MDRSLIRIFAAAAVIVLGCSCYDRHTEPAPEAARPEANATIGELHRLLQDGSTTVGVPLTVTGVVTADDAADNFYRTVMIQEGMHALELMAGIDGLHRITPAGCRVTLQLEGLLLARRDGILQAGTPPESYSGYPTGYLSSRVEFDRRILRTGHEELFPLPVFLPVGDPALCGTLVTIEGLTYSPEDPDEAAVWSGERRFTDAQGHEIHLYTRDYARFAAHAIPSGSLALTGILQLRPGKSDSYQLKLRTESDCRLLTAEKP